MKNLSSNFYDEENLKKNLLTRGGNQVLGMMVSDSRAYLESIGHDIEQLKSEMKNSKLNLMQKSKSDFYNSTRNFKIKD